MMSDHGAHVYKLLLGEEEKWNMNYVDQKKEICDQYHEGISDPSRVVAKLETRYAMRK